MTDVAQRIFPAHCRRAAEPRTSSTAASRLGCGRRLAWKLILRLTADLGKLEGLGPLRRQQERLFVSPLDAALAQLQAVWDKFLASEPKVAAK